MPTDNYTYHQV